MKNEMEEILELFCPVFDQDKTNRFYALVNRISQAYPNYRAQIIRQELDGFSAHDENIEDMKYKATLNRQRWQWHYCWCFLRRFSAVFFML